MKLVHVDLEKPIAIHRNCPTEWIIESPELFLKYVEQLQKQNQGEEGNFVLSKADTELNMKRDVELILNHFLLILRITEYKNGYLQSWSKVRKMKKCFWKHRELLRN